MKVGFIGLPQSGKSTLFAAITGEQPDPYAQPAPRHSVVKVPDGRLDYLTELQKHIDQVRSNPSKWMPWNYSATLSELANPPPE